MQSIQVAIDQMVAKGNRSAHLNWSGIQQSAIQHVKRKQMEDKGLALMQMLNKKAVIDDEDPENKKIDENIA